jgi:threonine-phosphate decarboxylase
LLVVRSLTKFYGCPALRAGYAAGHPRTLARVSAIQPAWPVTGLALSALAEAVRDREYAWATRRENALRAEDLAQGLRGLGLQVFPTAANFLLFRLAPEMPAAAILSDRLLCDHHILIRNCDSYEALEPGRYIRVAVRTAEENDRLLAALRKTVLPQ